MEQYIPKSVLVAEINRVLNSYDPNEITSGRYALVDLRNFIDTLEVKEVDSNDTFIKKVCDAYCKACNKPSYSVPIPFCRRKCESYDNFIKNINL